VPNKGRPLVPLTARECAVRDHMSNCWKTKKIASALGLSCRWVEAIRADVFAKYGIDPQAEDGQSKLVRILLEAEAIERTTVTTLARAVEEESAKV